MIAVRFFAALLVLLAAAPAMSQDRRVPASAAELKLSYAPIVQRVQPAVVNVYAAKVVQNRNPLLDDPIFRRFFGAPDGGDDFCGVEIMALREPDVLEKLPRRVVESARPLPAQRHGELRHGGLERGVGVVPIEGFGKVLPERVVFHEGLPCVR